jgi:hypothetical protein
MDNGLIFPYRRKTAHAEQGILTARNLPDCPSGWKGFGGARDLILGGKRINRCDAGR